MDLISLKLRRGSEGDEDGGRSREWRVGREEREGGEEELTGLYVA